MVEVVLALGVGRVNDLGREEERVEASLRGLGRSCSFEDFFLLAESEDEEEPESESSSIGATTSLDFLGMSRTETSFG